MIEALPSLSAESTDHASPATSMTPAVRMLTRCGSGSPDRFRTARTASTVIAASPARKSQSEAPYPSTNIRYAAPGEVARDDCRV